MQLVSYAFGYTPNPHKTVAKRRVGGEASCSPTWRARFCVFCWGFVECCIELSKTESATLFVLLWFCWFLVALSKMESATLVVLQWFCSFFGRALQNGERDQQTNKTFAKRTKSRSPFWRVRRKSYKTTAKHTTSRQSAFCPFVNIKYRFGRIHGPKPYELIWAGLPYTQSL